LNQALQALEAMLRNSAAALPRFPANSRYAGIALTVHEAPDGRPVVHLCRRFVPQPERFVTIAEHALREHERLDTLAARYFADPELFYRLCDANRALFPEELLAQVARVLRITLPEGIPGGDERA
jgi:hypothetical protein